MILEMSNEVGVEQRNKHMGEEPQYAPNAFKNFGGTKEVSIKNDNVSL